LEIYYYVSYPATPEKDKAIYSSIFQKLAEITVQEELVGDYLRDHLRRTQAAEISLLGIEVADGKRPYEDLKALMAVSSEVLSAGISVEEFVTDDLEDIYNKHYSGVGLTWRLNTLNRMLGPLRIGDFGFLFARPETGKTTILASEVSFMALQADSPIVWFNNEQPGEVVKARIYQSHFGITSHELFANRKLYQARYLEELSGRIKVYDSGSIHRRDVERVCANLHPSLIVFDQLPKIKGFEVDRYDLMLGAIYQWGRELSKKYCPVIGVCQAGGTGEGKKWLDMDDVDSSKTAMQAEADFILGIGKSNQDGMEAIRHLHLCKNKLIGGEQTIPELRHGRCEVLIKADIARFEDLPERK
jgi:replicative DNA helicase